MARMPKHWQNHFLEVLRETGIVRTAAEAAGVGRTFVYHARVRDSVFAKKWDAAMADAIDLLEAIAFKRASEISDTLLIFLLKSHRPERYADRLRIDFVRQEAARLAEGTDLSADELIALAEEIMAGKVAD